MPALDLPEQTLFTPRAWQSYCLPQFNRVPQLQKPPNPAPEPCIAWEPEPVAPPPPWLGGAGRLQASACGRARLSVAAGAAEGAGVARGALRTALGRNQYRSARGAVSERGTDPLGRFAPPRRPRQWPNLPDSPSSPPAQRQRVTRTSPPSPQPRWSHAPRSPREAGWRRMGTWRSAGPATLPSSPPATRTAPGAWSVRSSARWRGLRAAGRRRGRVPAA